MSPLAALALVIAAAPLAFADEPKPTAPAATPAPAKDSATKDAAPDGAHVSFEAFTQHAFRSNLSNNQGDVSTTTSGFTMGLALPAAERTTLALGLEGEYRWYNFRNSVRIDPVLNRHPGKLWRDTEQLAFTAIINHQFDDRWAAFIGGGVDSSREVGAEFGDSLTYGGVVGGTYKVNDTLNVGLNLVVRSRLEDSALFIPFPLIDWKINDQWRLNTDRKVHRGGLNLSYTPSNTWTFTLSAGLQSGEYRLVDNGVSPEGVGRDWRVPVVLEAAWKPDPHVELAIYAGSEVWGQVTVDDKNGNEFQKNDVDPNLLVGGSVTLKW